MASRVLGAGVVLATATAFTPLPNQLAAALRPAGEARAADAIVVLGAGVNPDATPSPPSLLRLVRGLALYRQGLAPFVVLTGDRAEIHARVDLAVTLGIPAAALVTATARTTREEPLAVQEALGPGPSRHIILVTTGTHLRRAAALFERAGFSVAPAAADFISDGDDKPELRLELIRMLGQEIVARLYYRVAGYL